MLNGFCRRHVVFIPAWLMSLPGLMQVSLWDGGQIRTEKTATRLRQRWGLALPSVYKHHMSFCSKHLLV